MTVTELAEFPGPGGRGRRAAEGGAGTVRWRPSRAGVLNVWRYYDEVFTFHQGRLLLRGPNGTGKSKALEVLLPFLFDASLKPNRLSTFGGSERTMHWNLMGEGATGVTRVGYVWLEFRTDRDGATRWFTIGARLQATSRTTSVGVDFFTAHAPIGQGDHLSLVNEAGQPLAVAALKEVLAGRGEVHDTAADYRAAVRQTLFPGLSEQRYDALITALLQLRTPKLSERLDPTLLSTLLSHALPPLDRDEIAELADGFERLDRQREELIHMDERVDAARKLAARQRSYAQRVLRVRAAELISATTEMDNRSRAARETEDAYERAVQKRETAEEQLSETKTRAAEVRSRIEVLTESEEYRQGRELDRLRQQVSQAREVAQDRRATAGAARKEAGDESERAADAQEQAAVQRGAVRAAEEESWQAARAAGLGAVCTELAAVLAAGEAAPPEDRIIPGAGPPDPARPTGPRAEDRARQLVSGAVRGRLAQIAEVRAAVDAHRAAVGARTAAEEAQEQARAALAEAAARRQAMASSYGEAVQAQAARLQDWARSCVELRFDAAALAELAEQATDETGVLALSEAVARPVERELTTEETTAGQRRQVLAGERARAAEEVARLEQAADLPPEPPRTRTGDRDALPGAPLWKLVAFHDTVPAWEQAAVEAALEASGLLDAWVGPHGHLLAAGHDTFAEPGWAAQPLTGRNLTGVLRPELDAPVAAERIERLLSSIAYGDTLPTGAVAAIAAGTAPGALPPPRAAGPSPSPPISAPRHGSGPANGGSPSWP